MVPQHLQEVLPLSGDIRLLSGQTDDCFALQAMLGVEKGEEVETAEHCHCRRAWQVLGTQEVTYGSWGRRVRGGYFQQALG